MIVFRSKQFSGADSGPSAGALHSGRESSSGLVPSSRHGPRTRLLLCVRTQCTNFRSLYPHDEDPKKCLHASGLASMICQYSSPSVCPIHFRPLHTHNRKRDTPVCGRRPPPNRPVRGNAPTGEGLDNDRKTSGVTSHRPCVDDLQIHGAFSLRAACNDMTTSESLRIGRVPKVASVVETAMSTTRGFQDYRQE